MKVTAPDDTKRRDLLHRLGGVLQDAADVVSADQVALLYEAGQRIAQAVGHAEAPRRVVRRGASTPKPAFRAAVRPHRPAASPQQWVDEADVRSMDARLLASMKASVDAIFAGTDWLTAAQVGLAAAGQGEPANPYATAHRWRRQGRIFGLERRGQWLYPAYQFDATLQPRPAVREVLGVLSAGFSPLAVASWFESTNSLLDGGRPRERLASDPAAVLAAARDHAEDAAHG